MNVVKVIVCARCVSLTLLDLIVYKALTKAEPSIRRLPSREPTLRPFSPYTAGWKTIMRSPSNPETRPIFFALETLSPRR